MKKSLKKICSILALAVCSACLTVSPVQASATTFKQGDVNGDGVVNVSDSQAITKFLLGKAGADGATSERLDVDQNGIIDVNDKTLLRNIILHNVSGSTVTSRYTTELPQQEKLTYYKYGAYNGNYKGSYTLETSPNISTISTHDLFGETDDRVLESGLSGVVKIKKRNEAYGFTGFVVDDHTILTCAHGLYGENTGIPLELWDYEIVFYDETGNIIDGMVATPKEYHIPEKFIQNVNDNLQNGNNYDFEKYDYALITITDGLTNYINFNLGVPRDNLPLKEYSTYITGINNGTHSDIKYRKTTSFGDLIDIDNYKLYNNIDTSGGQSGSPIYVTNSDGSKTVIGIHTYGYNCGNDNGENHTIYNHGTRMNTNILNFIYNNNNLTW